MKNILNTMNARLVRVEVVALKDDVFFGSLVIESDGQTIEVDSRPSDALALAVRYNVPIMVAKEVMDIAGIIPERDIQTKPETSQSPEEPSREPATEERLSVFEDFLQNLEIDDLSEDADSGDQDDQEPDKPKGKGKGNRRPKIKVIPIFLNLARITNPGEDEGDCCIYSSPNVYLIIIQE